MSTACEIALQVLPHFTKNVLAGRVYSYGHYATATGRDAATGSVVIGKAMHAIGGACVMCAIPVAPLHFVERTDREGRGVFESDELERVNVLPHYNLLYVTAREFKYSEKDFRRIENALRVILPKHLEPSQQMSPHGIWSVAISVKLSDSSTIFERALSTYRELNAKTLAARGAL